jgi:ABC-type uncharacterized transport system permease subunit
MIPSHVIYGYIIYSFFQLIGIIYGSLKATQSLILLALGLVASLVPGALYVSAKRRADSRATIGLSDWTPSILLFLLILVSFLLGVYASI